jgi:hypothetical protein
MDKLSKVLDMLDGIKDIVREEIIDEFVRELLGDLRNPEEGNEGWAESTIDWLVNTMYGDPGPAESETPETPPATPDGVDGFSIGGRD